MGTRRVTQFVAVCFATGVGVSSASDVVEARLGATVRVTTVQATDAAGLPVARQGADPQAAPSPAPGASLPAGAPRVLLGTLVEMKRDAITVRRQSEKDRVRIPRTEIARLELRRGHTRGRNALIGTGIGAAIGLGWAVIEHSRCKREGDFLGLCGLAFGIPILTTPAGALVGVAIPGNQRWIDASAPGVAMLPSRTSVRLAWSVTF